MNYDNAARVYRKVGITTAEPGRLVIMCYEGAIENLKMAIEFYNVNAIEKKAEALVKALDFISGLNRAIDFKQGGQIAKNLHSLYNYMTRRILEGDLKRDLDILREIAHILQELKSAWIQILPGAPKKRVQADFEPARAKNNISGWSGRI